MNITLKGAQNVVYLFFGIIFLELYTKPDAQLPSGDAQLLILLLVFHYFGNFSIIFGIIFKLVFELDTNDRTFSFICFVICPNEDAHVKS